MPGKEQAASGKRTRLLYFYTAESSFVTKDIRILFEAYEVKVFRFDLYRKKQLPFTLLKQLAFLCVYFLRARLVICQFAGLHSFFPVLFSTCFGKKSLIVAGGTDCVSFPSIRYGNFYNKRNAWLSAFSYRHCSLILPVHESLVSYHYTYQNQDHEYQGLKHHVKDLNTPIQVIYNGYEADLFKRDKTPKPAASFLTAVGYINSRFTYSLKGIDLYIEAARHFPEGEFSILGGIGFDTGKLPPNIKLIPHLSGQALIDCFARHRFYMQLSMSEGFPNALSEAMLCECVPLVSRVGGMPDIVGELGYILNRRNSDELFELVQKALNDPDQEVRGKDCRERIKSLYPLENRRKALLKSCESLLN